MEQRGRRLATAELRLALDGAGVGAVRRSPFAGEQVGEDRFVQQGMAELVVLLVGDDQVLGHRRTQAVGEIRFTDVGDDGEQLVGDPAASDRGGAQDPLGVLW